MLKRIGVLLVIVVLLTGSIDTVYGKPSENAAENNVNGVEHRATPADPGEPGSPATPGISARKQVDKDNLLLNSHFEEDLSLNEPDVNGVVDTELSWIFYTNSGALASYEMDKNVMKIVPEYVGAPEYGIQLIQSPITIEKQGIYEVSVRAKAETDRNIAIKVGATGELGWVAYGMKTIPITTKMATYTFEFTMLKDTDDGARFEMFFAQDIAPVWVEYVTLKKIGEAEPIISLEELLARTKTEEDENLVEDWQLVWSDEFNDPSINMDNWTFEIGNGAEKGIPGWGNGELEYYTDSADNAFIEDGSLVIRALEEEKNFTVDGVDYTTDYTSSRMVTEGKVTTSYSRIEGNIQVPSGQGIWAAFWMLGTDIGEVGWPYCGEIDILEYIGSNVNEIHGTVHGPVSAGPGINGHIDQGIDLSQDYHVYAIEWDEDEVEFYIDDILYHIVNKDEVALEYGPDEWVYDHDHYLILNLAVGGNWPGAPDETTIFPKQMKVDYIRIYEDVNEASIDGEEIIDTIYELPQVTPGIDGFVNGTFDENTEGWTSYYHYDAVGSFAAIGGEGVFNLENDGSEDYSAHIYQGPFLFDASKIYTLTFDARADVNRDLLVVIDNIGYYRFVNEIVPLTNTMTTFTIEVSGIGEEATIKFLSGELGNNIEVPNHVYLDNISIQEKDETFDDSTNIIDDNNWQLWEADEWSGPGAAIFSVTDGNLSIEVTAVGYVAHSPQVYQEGFTFVNGETYQVSFDAKALAPKTINVNVGKALGYDPWWTAYAPTQTYILGTEVTSYTFNFVMNEETFDNGKIVFELGTINGDTTLTTIEISNIKILSAKTL